MASSQRYHMCWIEHEQYPQRCRLQPSTGSQYRSGDHRLSRMSLLDDGLERSHCDHKNNQICKGQEEWLEETREIGSRWSPRRDGRPFGCRQRGRPQTPKPKTPDPNPRPQASNLKVTTAQKTRFHSVRQVRIIGQ